MKKQKTKNVSRCKNFKKVMERDNVCQKCGDKEIGKNLLNQKII